MKYYTNNEKVSILSDKKIEIRKKGGLVKIEANAPMKVLARVFNFVPGMEALPIQFTARDLKIKISVS